MFSSLPSASKIYQNPVKPRQKSAPSAKKRRKKVHSSLNQHANILDDSVMSLVSCDQESSSSVINGQKGLLDSSCRHSFERENSSPEISLYSVETCQTNSRSYNSIPEQDDHARILCEIEEKNVKKVTGDLCIEQNETLSKQMNESDQINLFDSNIEESSKINYADLIGDKLQEESEAELSAETIITNSDQQNLSCEEGPNEEIKFDITDTKDISEMTFEEVEASIENSYLKESLHKAMQMNETADEGVHSEDLGSNASLQSSKIRYSVSQNNSDISNVETGNNLNISNVERVSNPDISNVESVSNLDSSNVDIANTAHHIACKEENGSCVKDATHSPNFDICNVKSSDDVASLSHEEDVDSTTVVDSEPHMDIVLADINGNCLSDNSKENMVCWTNADSCNSNDHSIEVSIMKEPNGPIKDNVEFPLRTDSPEQSELSCTESVLCEAKDYHQEILLPEKTFSNSNDKSEDHILSSEKPKEDFNVKGSSNISQSFSNLLREDSETVVSSRCFSVPEDLHLSKTFVDKHSQSAFPTVSDKATLTADLEWEESSKECSSHRNSSSEESQNESREHQLAKTSVSGSEDKSSLWNVLPPLAMVKARSRSYVFGSKGPSGSLLGSDELSRFFPDNQLTVFVGTWNMNGHDPPQSIDDFLLPLSINTLPDIYAIGVQESMQSRLEWEVLLQTTLGTSHVLFTSTSLGVLHLCIFLRRDLIWFCSEPEEASVATRPGTMVKTKGAVAVCFMCFGTSFLFVNSHLTAHEQKLKERLSDYEKIISSLDLPKSIPTKNHSRDKDMTSRFDCVFWCGDLNFRVMHDRPSVLSFVEEKVRSARPSCSFLVKRDQLHKAMEEGRAFHGFKESVIHFIPSYKFDVGTSTFNSSKLRVPSYTDRILYRSREKSSVSCLHYNAVPNVLTSDHKPVYAVFKVTLKPGRDNVPLAAGMFKRDVYLEAIKRRSKFLEVRQNLGQSTICSVM
ncbi:unnamed protein product [Larinioides sclopetarius]|uniref:Inositol polyphosphate-related phosphatase domain-containing protein n=1 Tax=Larinioides sclopetarius TaxID=280406 RepID=A0AAV2BMR3_9ARAC